MAVVWLAPERGATPLEPEQAEALLTLHAAAGDQLQHLRVRAGPGATPEQLIVFGFFMTSTVESARHTLLVLAETAIAAELALRNWRVI